jgi:iron complex outermembrane recepter protein
MWNQTLAWASCLMLIGMWSSADVRAQSAAAADDTAIGEITVTARRREESLQDVPIAVTAISGDALEQRQIYSVKDIAAYSPGLNINSDSAGRSFVSIRGIGTTLINTVQPGVGIFLDGVYQPDTSYLNSPIVDVQRIEVLRGPQGTLFGNNTLGGAINVITKQPGDEFEGKASGAYAGPDNFYSAALSVSGPIIPGALQARIALADHSQDGFERNTLAGSWANPLNDKSANATLRWEAAESAVFTFNGYYNRVFGGSTPYARVAGPQDYQEAVTTNQNSTVTLYYKGANLKGVFDVKPLDTTITATLAYDRRDDTSSVDGDFGPVDLLRAQGVETLQTRTGELRFDTNFTDKISTLIGFFASHETTNSFQVTTLFVPITTPPTAVQVPASSLGETNSQAIFGTAFWKFADTWELASGVRYDHQVLDATTNSTAADYKASEWDGRITLTKHWSADAMTYASIARGFRGGGQNPPGSPNLIYKGDSVVTSELGTKFQALDHRLSIDADVFYNNYAHFIGQNSLAPSTGGVGFVAINLNSGQVKSYGAELESHFNVTREWRLDAGLTLLHSRIVNQGEYEQTTGTTLPSDRILFTPDWNYNLDSSYTFPMVNGRDFVELMVGTVGKGSRTGSSLDPAVAPMLSSYSLINASLTYRMPHLEFALFATNLLDRQYFESYIDSSALIRAGLPAAIASDLGIMGDRRRVGIRGKYSF